MRRLFIIMTILMAATAVAEARPYHSIGTNPYVDHDNPWMKFRWGFNLGLGVLGADAGYFGCTSPQIDAGLTTFEVEGLLGLNRTFSVFSRLGIGVGEQSGHDLNTISLLAALRADFGRLFLYFGGGVASVQASSLSDGYGTELVNVHPAASFGVGYSLVKNHAFRLEIEGSVLAPMDTEEWEPGFGTGQVSLGFKW